MRARVQRRGHASIVLELLCAVMDHDCLGRSTSLARGIMVKGESEYSVCNVRRCRSDDPCPDSTVAWISKDFAHEWFARKIRDAQTQVFEMRAAYLLPAAAVCGTKGSAPGASNGATY